jgi:ketosteroid isomerase-like protein
MNPSNQENENEMLSAEAKFILANHFLSVLKTRDWDLLRSILTEDAGWTLPGSSLIAGHARGAEGVVKRAQRIVSFDLAFQLNHISYGLYGVSLSLHHKATRGELVLDQHWDTVCRVRAGKISALDTYISDVDGVNEFFQEEA